MKKSFIFEKKLSTKVGGMANLDGFFKDDKGYTFIEAKCHEPYSSHKTTSVSKAYEPLYRYVNENMNGKIKIEMKPSGCGRYMNAVYFAKDENIERFDIKQMICHLLGIAVGTFDGSFDEKKPLNFIYLLYDPTELDISGEEKTEIVRIYKRTCYECDLISFPEIFRVILSFLNEKYFDCKLSQNDILNRASYFRFTLASQKNYNLKADG